MLIGLDILITFIALAAGVSALLIYSRMNTNRKTIASLPPPALGKGDESLADRLKFYYRISQRSVRMLEHLLEDYSVSPMIEIKDKQSIDQIISDFYKE